MNMSVCALLRRYRGLRGLTQQEVADLIGITASAYGKIENGIRGLDACYYKPVCVALDIPRMIFLDALLPSWDESQNDSTSFI